MGRDRKVKERNWGSTWSCMGNLWAMIVQHVVHPLHRHSLVCLCSFAFRCYVGRLRCDVLVWRRRCRPRSSRSASSCALAQHEMSEQRDAMAQNRVFLEHLWSCAPCVGDERPLCWPCDDHVSACSCLGARASFLPFSLSLPRRQQTSCDGANCDHRRSIHLRGLLRHDAGPFAFPDSGGVARRSSAECVSRPDNLPPDLQKVN